MNWGFVTAFFCRTGQTKCQRPTIFQENLASCKVLEGPCKGKQGLVEHIYKGMLFIYDRHHLEHAGFICAKAQSCVLVGGSRANGDRNGNLLASRPAQLSTPTHFPNYPGRGGPPLPGGRHRGGGRGKDSLVGTTIKIRMGAYKGYKGRVLDVSGTSVQVELESQMKVVRVERNQIYGGQPMTPGGGMMSPAVGRHIDGSLFLPDILINVRRPSKDAVIGVIQEVLLEPPLERPKGHNSSDEESTLLETMQLWTQSNEFCPQGTVPIRRTTENDVLRASSLKRFGRKIIRRVRHDTTSGSHEHVVAFVNGGQYYGAKASINVWMPAVTDPYEFSLSQLWVISGSFGNDLNTVEAGWQVSPELYGDGYPRFFTYWTTGAYQTTGCNNLLYVTLASYVLKNIVARFLDVEAPVIHEKASEFVPVPESNVSEQAVVLPEELFC